MPPPPDIRIVVCPIVVRERHRGLPSQVDRVIPLTNGLQYLAYGIRTFRLRRDGSRNFLVGYHREVRVCISITLTYRKQEEALYEQHMDILQTTIGHDRATMRKGFLEIL